MRLPSSCLAARQHRPKGQATLICSLVIALSSTLVISTTVQSTSMGDKSVGAPVAAAPQSIPSIEPVKADVAAKPKPDAQVEAETAAAPAAEQPKPAMSGEPAKAQSDSEQARKGRSEAPSDSAAAKQTTDKPADSKTSDKAAPQRAAEQQKSVTTTISKSASGSLASSSSSSSKSQLSGKSGSTSGKKLPANLGTVTSTGSGGPAHYMSKHDAYSAIAEKHGALAQDAMRKPDKRQHHASNLQQRFGGIQKASGLGDALNPFKGDSGLARTLGASMRSIMKGKYSVPAYLASAVLGAVALMAFYESPISPLPVPALPEPPVGRFPPEMPVISPNLQVPFRTNQGQQQNYGQQYGQQQNGYQRSSPSYQQGQPMQQLAGQQPQQQQVVFPGAAAQTAQQRQGTAPGPVQQLAANLISSVGVGANRPTQARADHDASSSRSFFGSSNQQPGASKLGASSNQPAHKQTGLLSFLGLGGSSGEGSTAASAAGQQPALSSMTDIHRASGLGAHHVGAGGGPVASAAGHEHKGQSALSNSHLINKMKSYFDRPVAHSSWSMDHNVPNQYDQYRRMSIIQALAKDTAFLSSFFTPSRRSSNSSSPVSASQLQQSINSVLSAATGSSPSSFASASQQVAAARMQVDNIPSLFPYQQPQQQQPIVNTKRASSGYGLMRAADRIGHALLDTFTSSLLHRSGSGSGTDGPSARKAAFEEQQQQNALASATSLLSDIMSSYNAAQASTEALSNAAHHVQQAPADKQQQPEQASGRSADQTSEPTVAQSAQPAEQQQAAGAPTTQQQAASATKPQSSVVSSPEQTSGAAPQQSQQQLPLSRKTRSVGLDYALEQFQPQQPSRASQINNLVDMVSDSYKQNKLLFSFVMNQVGLSQALPYVDQFLGTPNEPKEQ